MDASALEDKELQDFLTIEQQKAQFQSQIGQLTNTCWDLCLDKPRDKMDARSQTCVGNCVNRFIDVSVLITQRFQQLMQKHANQ